MSDPARLDAAAMRERYDRVRIKRSNRGKAPVFHAIDDEGVALCGRDSPLMYTRSLAVYPPGHFGWCDDCRRLAASRSELVTDGGHEVVEWQAGGHDGEPFGRRWTGR